MAGKVTMQDIADALGISRNTVSKAINNKGVLAGATRERVLKKAAELGYRQFSRADEGSSDGGGGLLPAEPPSGEGETADDGERLTEGSEKQVSFCPSACRGMIAVFTTMTLGSNHFPAVMLDRFRSEFLRSGYGFVIYPIGKNEVRNLYLPHSFHRENTAGIICFEIFDRPYCDMLCEMGLPVLFVDAPVSFCHDTPKADRLLMENYSGIYSLVGEMVRRGKKKIGFIGETDRCQSFWERYLALLDAFIMFGLPHKKEWCITGRREAEDASDQDYQIYLTEKLRNLKKLPDVFLCANDYVAVHVLKSFRELGISVPDDVYLCGFDDSFNSTIITPSLTTVRVQGDALGNSAVWLLLSRIQDPDLNYRTVYAETVPVYRESTGDGQ